MSVDSHRYWEAGEIFLPPGWMSRLRPLFKSSILREQTLQLIELAIEHRWPLPPLKQLKQLLLRKAPSKELSAWLLDEMVPKFIPDSMVRAVVKERYEGEEVYTDLYRTERVEDSSWLKQNLLPNRPLHLLVRYISSIAPGPGARLHKWCEDSRAYYAPLAWSISFVKSIGEIFKKYAHVEDWFWFVDLHQSLGYVQSLPEQADSLAKQLHSLLLRERRSTPKEFATVVKSVAKDCIKRRRPRREMYEWIQSLDWVTGGSLPGVKYDGGLRLQKRAAPLVFSPDDIQKDMLSETPFNSKVLLKADEPSKLRLIVSSDFAEFMLGAYLFDGCTATLPITVGWSTQEQSSVLYEMQDAMRRGEIVLPLDYSSFDHQVTRDEVLLALEAILLAVGAPPPLIELYLRRFSATRLRISEELVRLTEWPRDSYNWEGGVLSGSFYTALLDSVVNQTWLRIVSARGYSQGDDTAAFVPSWQEGIRVVRSLQADLKLDINVSKFFISANRTEYLRTVVERRKVYQYPARTINGVLYSKPNSASDIDPVARARAIADNIAQTLKRGRVALTPAAVEPVPKSRRSLVWSLLCNPIHSGGFGFKVREEFSVPVGSPEAPPLPRELMAGWVPDDPGFEGAWKEVIERRSSEGVVDVDSRAKRRAASGMVFRKYRERSLPLKESASFTDLFGALGKLSRPFEVYQAANPGLTLSALLRKIALSEPSLAGVGRLINRIGASEAKAYLTGGLRAPMLPIAPESDVQLYIRAATTTLYPSIRDSTLNAREKLLLELGGRA